MPLFVLLGGFALFAWYLYGQTAEADVSNTNADAASGAATRRKSTAAAYTASAQRAAATVPLSGVACFLRFDMTACSRSPTGFSALDARRRRGPCGPLAAGEGRGADSPSATPRPECGIERARNARSSRSGVDLVSSISAPFWTTSAPIADLQEAAARLPSQEIAAALTRTRTPPAPIVARHLPPKAVARSSHMISRQSASRRPPSFPSTPPLVTAIGHTSP